MNKNRKRKYKIRSIFEDKEANSKLVTSYTSIREASLSIDTKMDNWKVQMLIADAINNNKRAFKMRWQKIED